MELLKKIIDQNRNGNSRGIYSICSAHPLVIEAAFELALSNNSPLLIEATANQVNQFGGYTGMRATEFYKFVTDLAISKNFPIDNIILGGDHLGPVCWKNENASDAMKKADDLIKEYVAAGFKKIHLDCSMECADDVAPLSDEIVAERAARLCLIAEKEAKRLYGSSDILYIIGTEVPPPGGKNEELSELETTNPDHALKTLNIHKKSFIEHGLADVWESVVGLVVQPGVEFSHTSIVQYAPEKAVQLKALINKVENIVFEAHSTDYQNPENYKLLVQDHFAILKVGPQLTFAMREALYALSHIETYLIDENECSNLYETCEAEMTGVPKYWDSFYTGSEDEKKFLRHFSYSDRIRYYWTNPEVAKAVRLLLTNLSKDPIPLPLISQFFPEQYGEIMLGRLQNNPEELVKAKIKSVLKSYAAACNGETIK